jgi:hypothetical protein
MNHTTKGTITTTFMLDAIPNYSYYQMRDCPFFSVPMKGICAIHNMFGKTNQSTQGTLKNMSLLLHPKLLLTRIESCECHGSCIWLLEGRDHASSCQKICMQQLSHQCSQNQSWRQSLLKFVCSKGVPYHLEVSGHLTGLQVCLALIKRCKRLSHGVKQCQPSTASAIIRILCTLAHDHLIILFPQDEYIFHTPCHETSDKIIRDSMVEYYLYP